MPIADVLAKFRTKIGQCDSLIKNSHQQDNFGSNILPALDREQITVAAFLNMFIAWESFLESALAEFMLGGLTLSGSTPKRYVLPTTLDHANKLVIHTSRFFDYANHNFFSKAVSLYFEDGYAFEPHFGSIMTDLSDLRTMRNGSAHISSTTQVALEALAFRIFSGPKRGVTLYQMLTAFDPRLGVGETVFSGFKDKILIAAELIAKG